MSSSDSTLWNQDEDGLLNILELHSGKSTLFPIKRLDLVEPEIVLYDTSRFHHIEYQWIYFHDHCHKFQEKKMKLLSYQSYWKLSSCLKTIEKLFDNNILWNVFPTEGYHYIANDNLKTTVKSSILLKYAIWRKIWRYRKADMIRILFKSRFLLVEKVLLTQQYYLAVFIVCFGFLWVAILLKNIKTNPQCHFDTLKIVPAPLTGTFVNILETGVRIVLGDQTSPLPLQDTYKEELLSSIVPLFYCFSIGVVVLSSFYQKRPLLILTLIFWISLSTLFRISQASYFTKFDAEELLCYFTRQSILLQQQEANEEPTSFTVASLQKTPLEKFQQHLLRYYFVSEKKYINVALLFCCISLIIHISPSLHRLIAINFEEFYYNSQSFSFVCKTPIQALCIDFFVSMFCLYITLTVYKIPMLSILITSTHAQAVQYFTHRFPCITPYAIFKKNKQINFSETLYIWNNARYNFFEKVNRHINLVQKPANVFYIAFFLLLTSILLFSSNTSFFLYNEYGLAISLAALATSCILLAYIHEAEKAYKIIHEDQETLFWDWWTTANVISIEKNLLTRPLPVYEKMYPTLSCAGVPLRKNSLHIAIILLLWIWGKIFCASYTCHKQQMMHSTGRT